MNPCALFRHRFFDLRDELKDLYRNNDALYQEYDFSNFNEDNRLYFKHQKLEILKFKDAMGGKIIHSILALKSKLYSIPMGDKQKLSANGTTKYAQSLKHSVFYRLLAKYALLRTLNCTVNYKKQKFLPYQPQKYRCCFDDRRYLLPNGVDTLLITAWEKMQCFGKLVGDIEWGNNVLSEKKNKKEKDIHPN